MESRLNYSKLVPSVLKAMFGLEAVIRASGLEESLVDLMKLRASQINGCAACIDMHAKDLRAHGETEQRIYMLEAWREAPFYSARERAAFEWTEAVTLIEGNVSSEVFRRARAQFSEEEIVHLTLVVVAINGWNRFNIAFRTAPGFYEPTRTEKAKAVSPEKVLITH